LQYWYKLLLYCLKVVQNIAQTWTAWGWAREQRRKWKNLRQEKNFKFISPLRSPLTIVPEPPMFFPSTFLILYSFPLCIVNFTPLLTLLVSLQPTFTWIFYKKGKNEEPAGWYYVSVSSSRDTRHAQILTKKLLQNLSINARNIRCSYFTLKFKEEKSPSKFWQEKTIINYENNFFVPSFFVRSYICR